MSTIDKIVSEQTQLNSYIEPEEDVGVYPQWAKLMDASDSEKRNSWSNYPGFESLHNDDGRFFCTAKSFEEITDSKERTKLMQHWLVIAQRRQAYEDHYKKLQDETFGFLTSELNPTTQERKEMIDLAHVVFDATTHPCGLCNVEQVKYQQYSQDRCAQAIGGTFMACQTCLKQSVWTVQDATLGVAVSVDIPKQTYVARYKKAICPAPKA